uniref:ATP synthase F0 subunit 8 n=1 Tax=Litigonotus ghinii TaxID=3104745 RepID=A0AAU8MJ75_9BILA
MPHMAPICWAVVCFFIWFLMLVMFSKRWFGGFVISFKV